jgi:hypothetical protein
MIPCLLLPICALLASSTGLEGEITSVPEFIAAWRTDRIDVAQVHALTDTFHSRNRRAASKCSIMSPLKVITKR